MSRGDRIIEFLLGSGLVDERNKLERTKRADFRCNLGNQRLIELAS